MKKIILILMMVACWSASGLVSGAAERPKRMKPDAAGEKPTTAVSTAPAAAPAVLSIIPAQSEPGGRVMMFGSGFGSQASAYLGSVEITSKVTDGKQLEFTIPQQLEPGIYALYLKRSDGAVSRPYNFSVTPVRPVLEGVQPEQVGSCAHGKDRDVTVRGQNFSEKSQLLFDGAVLKSTFVSPETLSFSVPQVSGGLHQIVVKNGPDNGTVAIGLIIETKPEISQVATGSEYVNYYELVITGKNFQQNSAIFVDGLRVGGRGGDYGGEREKLIYVDCGKLIYQRHPYSQVNKDFRIMVMNPGNEASQAVSVTAP